jgi:cytidine deaminase
MDIVAVGVVTSAPKLCKPCGACRQVIAEFSRADNPIIIISTTDAGLSATETITTLLPDNFTLL